MKMRMTNFLTQNFGWIVLALVGFTTLFFAISKMHKAVDAIKSADFSNDPAYSTPVMENNPHADIFRKAAQAAIEEKINPWVYLQKNWDKVKNFGNVEKALLDFITKEAHQRIPDSANVSLSIRDYSDPNSVVMEYRDSKTDSIMITTGHDPEPALYATFTNKNEARTFKLVCANGLVRELGGTITGFENDHVVKPGDSFIGLTGSTPIQAAAFAEKNNLSVRFVLEGLINSKTPDFTNAKVYKDFAKKKKGVFDVIMQPGDILRKQDGKWLYVPASTSKKS